jgi:hypothetical protein
MLAHLAHYVSPPLQKLVLRILLLVPLNALNALLSVLLPPRDSVYFTLLLRDGYEGLVMVSFLHLLLGYAAPPPSSYSVARLSPETTTHESSSLLPLSPSLSFRLPPPACFWTLHPARHPHFLRLSKLGIYQYLMSRIGTTFLGVSSHALGVYCPESMSLQALHFYTTLWNGVSMVLSFFFNKKWKKRREKTFWGFSFPRSPRRHSRAWISSNLTLKTLKY